jgi:hypothetical protein
MIISCLNFVNRIGKKLVLTVKKRENGAEITVNDKTDSDMPPLQPNPVHVYVGGVAEKETVRFCYLPLSVFCLTRPVCFCPSAAQFPNQTICWKQPSVLYYGHLFLVPWAIATTNLTDCALFCH